MNDTYIVPPDPQPKRVTERDVLESLTMCMGRIILRDDKAEGACVEIANAFTQASIALSLLDTARRGDGRDPLVISEAKEPEPADG